MKKNGIILIIENDFYINWIFKNILSELKLKCIFFNHKKTLKDNIIDKFIDVIVLNIHISNFNGFNIVEDIKQYLPNIPIIIITEHLNINLIVNSYQYGSFECLSKPFDIDHFIKIIKQAINYHQEINYVKLPYDKKINHNFNIRNNIIGESIAMQDVFRIIGRLSRSSVSVFINGESGTGKELIAQALHFYSPRQKEPFIALNMAAIPNGLIESELFGHEKGAFTGANQTYKGKFEQANNGTLFLDEIGDMPIEVQTHLLRVLSDGTFYRIGGYNLIKSNVRIITATNQNLNKSIKKGKFREDLFHRLNIIKLYIPPLRERPEDIPFLANYFLQLSANEFNIKKKILNPETETKLTRLNWSGNVRQLENICKWMTLMIAHQEILVHDIPINIFNLQVNNDPKFSSDDWQKIFIEWIYKQIQSGQNNLALKIQSEIDRILLKTALYYAKGQKKQAAILLGLGRNTLTNKLKKLQIK